jgi:hypothetical protein
MTDEKPFTDKDVTRTVAAMRQDETALYLKLGIAMQYLYAPPNVKYSAPYEKMGRDLWASLQVELYDLICRPKSKTPRSWVQELISGDIRTLAVAILTALVATSSLPLSIAVPAAALVLKQGAIRYCKAGRPAAPKETVSQILAKKKQQMSESHKKTKK